MNENKTISGDDVLEMSRQQFSNETYSEFLKGRKQGALKVFNLIKEYHSPKSLGFELWTKIDNLIKGCEKDG